MSVISPPLVAQDQHAAAVEELVRQYRALGPDARVRLGKKTSNLFRFGDRDAQRLDTSALTGVIDVDLGRAHRRGPGHDHLRDLVDATLAHGLMPLVVPQLKTITLGGAVTGLGIESTSFRHGLPHESVREMDVLLTGDGDVVTATPDGEHADLFRGFPNSYGTLGYALRLAIELQPVAPLRPPASTCASTPPTLATVITERLRPSTGDRADFVDGTVFARDEQYLTARRVHRRPRPRGRQRLHRAADLLPLASASAPRTS